MSTEYLFPALKIPAIIGVDDDGTEIKLTQSEKLILISLADRADERGSCYPAQKDIAQTSFCTDRTVRTGLKRLEKLGFLRIQHRAIDGRQTSSRYFLNVTKMYQAMQFGEEMISRGGGNDFRDGVEMISRGGGNDFRDGVEMISDEPHNKNLTVNLTQEPHKDAPAAAAADTITAAFEQFRQAYPENRRHTEVKQARAQFARAAKKVGVSTIIAAAAAYKTHCEITGVEPQFVKSMWRWLRDERYTDQYTTNDQVYMSPASRKRAQMGIYLPAAGAPALQHPHQLAHRQELEITA